MNKAGCCQLIITALDFLEKKERKQAKKVKRKKKTRNRTERISFGIHLKLNGQWVGGYRRGMGS